MKKAVIIFLCVILALSLAACNEILVLDESKTYEVSGEIHSLDIRINAADFVIEHTDKFSVESNLKYLSVTEHNGVLRIVDEAKIGNNYKNAALTLCVPSGTVFDDVAISVGAAKMAIDTLSADSLKLNLGAGDVEFGYLSVTSDIEIEGGAGEITVKDGSLNNLTLDMGVGEFDLTAALLGECDLKFGVGQSDLSLLGGKAAYKLDIEKSVGNITVDGVTATDFGSSGDGENRIKIKGGVGTVNIEFKE